MILRTDYQVNPGTHVRVVPPAVHLNGTGASSLQEQYSAAAQAVYTALLALPAPNGRDYYVQADDAFSVAVVEHEARCARLREVLDELQAIAEHVAEGSDS